MHGGMHVAARCVTRELPRPTSIDVGQLNLRRMLMLMTLQLNVIASSTLRRSLRGAAHHILISISK
jgi:hypothetical protein